MKVEKDNSNGLDQKNVSPKASQEQPALEPNDDKPSPDQQIASLNEKATSKVQAEKEVEPVKTPKRKQVKTLPKQDDNTFKRDTKPRQFRQRPKPRSSRYIQAPKEEQKEPQEIELEGDSGATLVRGLLIKAAVTTKRDLVDKQIAKLKASCKELKSNTKEKGRER